MLSKDDFKWLSKIKKEGKINIRIKDAIVLNDLDISEIRKKYENSQIKKDYDLYWELLHLVGMDIPEETKNG